MTLKSDFRLLVRPVTDQFASDDERCAHPICPYAYNSVSDWYRGGSGPTFILVDPGMVRLAQPLPDTLDPPVSVLHAGRFVIYVYADDVASHHGDSPEVHAAAALITVLGARHPWRTKVPVYISLGKCLIFPVAGGGALARPGWGRS